LKKEIVNRVAKSPLITIDLEELYPSGNRFGFDIAPWLLEGIILKERAFRETAKTHDWSLYKNKYVALYCSTDAIIPAWAYMLISVYLAPFAIKTIVGNLVLLESIIFSEVVCNLDVSAYKEKSIILKGCSTKPIPETAYTLLIQKLQPIAKNIMYGEACSSVPLYKK
jgi:hypothetical protein